MAVKHITVCLIVGSFSRHCHVPELSLYSPSWKWASIYQATKLYGTSLVSEKKNVAAPWCSLHLWLEVMYPVTICQRKPLPQRLYARENHFTSFYMSQKPTSPMTICQRKPPPSSSHERVSQTSSWHTSDQEWVRDFSVLQRFVNDVVHQAMTNLQFSSHLKDLLPVSFPISFASP